MEGGLTSGGRGDAARAFANAVRGLVHTAVGSDAPAELFAGIADELSAAADRFRDHPQQWFFDGIGQPAATNDQLLLGDKFDGPFDLSPVMGRANPLAAPLHLEVERDRVVGTATFGRAYEGLPGCVHGGVVASAFDELMGLVQIYAGNAGMTGRLTVTYRRPTPLETEVHLEGRVDSIEGRKTICTGEIRTGDELCAEAEAIFIRPAPAHVASLFDDTQAD